MVHYLIELAIWMLIAYFLGCLVGWIIRNITGGQPATEVAPAPAQIAAAKMLARERSFRPNLVTTQSETLPRVERENFQTQSK